MNLVNVLILLDLMILVNLVKSMNLGILCMFFICNMWRLWFLLVYLVISANLVIPLNLVKLVSMVTLVNLVILEKSTSESFFDRHLHFSLSRERRAIIKCQVQISNVSMQGREGTQAVVGDGR